MSRPAALTENDTLTATARIVDGGLILSMPDARTPVVRRMDLAQARGAALELRANDDSSYTLVLKGQGGDSDDVATYDDRAAALRALMAVSRAMEKGDEQARPAVVSLNPADHLRGSTAAPHRSGVGRWLSALVAVILVFVLLGLILNLGPRQAQVPGGGAALATVAGEGASSISATPSGVPVSADAFLQNRQ